MFCDASVVNNNNNNRIIYWLISDHNNGGIVSTAPAQAPPHFHGGLGQARQRSARPLAQCCHPTVAGTQSFPLWHRPRRQLQTRLPLQPLLKSDRVLCAEVVSRGGGRSSAKAGRGRGQKRKGGVTLELIYFVEPKGAKKTTSCLKGEAGLVS